MSPTLDVATFESLDSPPSRLETVRLRIYELTLANWYCEKAFIAGVNQVTPLHFHWTKTKDIINRDAGKLIVQLYNASEEETLAETTFAACTDGIARIVLVGGTVVLGQARASPLCRIAIIPYRQNCLCTGSGCYKRKH
jgi:D-lyxose ketol-isomerase